MQHPARRPKVGQPLAAELATLVSATISPALKLNAFLTLHKAWDVGSVAKRKRCADETRVVVAQDEVDPKRKRL